MISFLLILLRICFIPNETVKQYQIVGNGEKGRKAMCEIDSGRSFGSVEFDLCV